MAEVQVYHYIRQSRQGEIKALGTIVNYIKPDRDAGEFTGAYEIRDISSHAIHEVDERDVWPVK